MMGAYDLPASHPSTFSSRRRSLVFRGLVVRRASNFARSSSSEQTRAVGGTPRWYCRCGRKEFLDPCERPSSLPDQTQNLSRRRLRSSMTIATRRPGQAWLTRRQWPRIWSSHIPKWEVKMRKVCASMTTADRRTHIFRRFQQRIHERRAGVGMKCREFMMPSGLLALRSLKLMPWTERILDGCQVHEPFCQRYRGIVQPAMASQLSELPSVSTSSRTLTNSCNSASVL